LEPTKGDYWRAGVFLWVPSRRARQRLPRTSPNPAPELEVLAIRSTYYAATTSAENQRQAIRRQLRQLDFTPEVIMRGKNVEAKGVDIRLATDVLSHAFLDNYDVAVLVTNDGDFVPVVEAIKRLGKVVWVAGIDDDSLSDELRLQADEFIDLGPTLEVGWRPAPE
jgi:uncharacterized LabA/DUF88 family protein